MKAEEWLERAEKRLIAADALFHDGIYEDCLFMAHQAIEVALKSVIVHKTGKLAPRLHSLQQLAKLSGFEKPSAFAGLEPAYAGVRYPDAPEVIASKEEVEADLNLARKVLKWSKSQLK